MWSREQNKYGNQYVRHENYLFYQRLLLIIIFPNNEITIEYNALF